MRIAQKIMLYLWGLFSVVFAASGWASDDTELEKASAQTLKTQLAVERLGYGDIDGSDASFARTRYSAGLRWKIAIGRRRSGLVDYWRGQLLVLTGR